LEAIDNMDSAHHLIKGFAMLRPNCLWQLLLSANRYTQSASGRLKQKILKETTINL